MKKKQPKNNHFPTRKYRIFVFFEVSLSILTDIGKDIGCLIFVMLLVWVVYICPLIEFEVGKSNQTIQFFNHGMV